ncbi:MAG: PA14 domain-containing protein [Planctomycetales bacterium]|nr:PA14 domain-containing protein [Planctomycetales bacterium]
MPWQVSRCLLLLMGLTSVRILTAAEVISPRVPGFERFYTTPLTTLDEAVITLNPVTGGRLLLGELNCLSCHVAPNEFQAVIDTKQAPILDDIGSRVHVDWLREYLNQPHSVKPGTTMPDVLAALPMADRANAVEALVHFLATTGSVTESPLDTASAKDGAALFHNAGCIACHAPDGDKLGDGKVTDLLTTITLPEFGEKYSVPSLTAFLKDPLKVRPSGRMPALGLTDEEYGHIAQHFVSRVRHLPNVNYAAYDCDGSAFPDYENQKPLSTGVCVGFDITAAGPKDKLALRFTTFLPVKTPSQYQITLRSKSGSRVSVGKERVVDNDGLHSQTLKAGNVVLDIGLHPVTVDYFHDGSGASLGIALSCDGIFRQPLAKFVSLSAKPPNSVPSKSGFVIDVTLADKGRVLFASLGCAACHQLQVDGRPVVSTLKTTSFADLKGANGCLAEAAFGNGPRYGLSRQQRASLVAVIASSQGDAGHTETPEETVHRTMASLNCYACHKRGPLGGVEKERDAYFGTTQQEMGDEGRLPPLLTGVGDKLKPEFLKHVLENGGDDRKRYMRVKMPKFGGSNVNVLIEPLLAVDLQTDPQLQREYPEAEYRIKAAGRHLVGGQALSCIKCHDFNEHPSTGIRAINLTRMTARVRPEWFDRYLRDPQRYRPGTRMPAPWPYGQATIRNVLAGNVDFQIGAVWMYLADGVNAAVPFGLVRQPIELKPIDSPILYRNFIEGAGSRAIGVGYPGQMNLAWDANDMRLALVWRGAFMDASRHWSGRGIGYEEPLGDDIVELAPHAPLAMLASPNDTWPTTLARDSGFRFLGYTLDSKQQPTFRYSFAGITVEDQSIPVKVDGQLHVSFRRTLRLTGPATERLYYRAVVASKIVKVADDTYHIDGFLTLTLTGGVASIRRAGETCELLVPVLGSASIIQDYVW